MELAIAVGSFFGIGGGTTATAGAVGGTSLLKTIVQGGLTAFSAASSIAGGIAARNEARIEQINAAASASRDKIAGEDEAIRINRALAEAIGEQQIAFAAAGIDLSSNTPMQAKALAQKRANEDLSISRSNTTARVGAWRQRGYAAEARGRAAVASGVAGAIGDIGGFVVDALDRGGPFAPARRRKAQAI